MTAPTTKRTERRKHARRSTVSRTQGASGSIVRPGVAPRTTAVGRGKTKAAAPGQAGSGARRLTYSPALGIADYARRLADATPLELVEIERRGVTGSFVKTLARHLGMPAVRMFTVLRVPKATAEKKAAEGGTLNGRAGQCAIGMARLLGIAQNHVASSTAAEAATFDAAKWLGRWLEHPQPSLGGRKPADLLDTPTGHDVVARLLGSIASGAYQ